ncbi:metal-dependent hydrolase [Mycobacterium sp. NAZ190054]|uniref:metal-dependent hydrolase n=1 Tax=Mycobacterium sp. NAZ190054 TaxID=1747766 RepID=UPI00079580D4|nr:metal-dependent hydrolase [Mycobacterium sp. NAZ190054]KWX68462.1 metal-dependent hydrolase [Mycobacterium sp. NAZ190054]
MTELVVRRPRFDFTGEVPWRWNRQNPAFSFFMNATSIIAVCFEQMIVAAVGEARPLITDPAVAEEATAFLRQEAQHSASHRKHVNALIAQYPGLQHTLDAAIAEYEALTATTPLAYRLAYIADLEATFTPTFKMMLDNEASLFRPGDERVASLFLWHFVEEVEHRSSALVIYGEVVGKPWYRLRMVPAVAKHLLRVIAVIADGVNTHVPEAERVVDARTLLPGYGLRTAFRQKTPAAFAGVPLGEKLIAGVRILLSQTPFHNPGNEPLPDFADEWFTRWERGDDVTHWYTSARTN